MVPGGGRRAGVVRSQQPPGQGAEGVGGGRLEPEAEGLGLQAAGIQAVGGP